MHDDIIEYAKSVIDTISVKNRQTQETLESETISQPDSTNTVIATVNGNGTLKDLTLSPNTLSNRNTISHLGEKIVSAINVARKKAAISSSKSLAPVVGEKTSAGILDSFHPEPTYSDRQDTHSAEPEHRSSVFNEDKFNTDETYFSGVNDHGFLR